MKKSIVFIFMMGILMAGCGESNRHTGVYMLLDTSGTYTQELVKAKSILNYLLGTLQPGDSMAVASIDTGSFSEKDIIAKVQFDDRPSVANNQKRAFQRKIEAFTRNVRRSPYTDISGGLLQAIEYLKEAGPRYKYILIFSDLKEELARGHIRDVPFELDGFTVIGLNVTKLRGDIRDPKQYMQRVEQWRVKIEEGDGQWRVINDLERLENMFKS